MAITLVQYKRGYGVANLSPFCAKAEILLKLAGLDYDIDTENDPRKSPKGKLPYIRDNGVDIADSALIQTHLETAHGADFWPGCSEADKAFGHALSRMCEERLYWVLVYARWIEEDSWPKIAAFWFGDLPPILRNLVPIIARKEVRKNLHAHGLGRHTPEQIYSFGAQDVAAISAALGDKDFLFGAAPTAADAVVYPYVEGVLMEELPSPLLAQAKSYNNLKPYVARCRNLWFADL